MKINIYHRFQTLAEIGEVEPIRCSNCSVEYKVHPWDSVDGEQIVLWCPGCQDKITLGSAAWEQIESVVSMFDARVERELYGANVR